MSDASTAVGELAREALPADQIWVLDDPRDRDAAQAIAIAERLGLPFRRVPLSGNWRAPLAALAPGGSLLGLAAAGHGSEPEPNGVARPVLDRRLPVPMPRGAGPVLSLSAGNRAASVALWLQYRFGTHAVHCMRPLLHGWRFDLLVAGEHDAPPDWPNVLPILGVPHRLSPVVLCQAKAAWGSRLAHLPRPRVALLVGGPVHGIEMVPAVAHRLGLKVATLARRRGGSVLATTGPRTGGEATDALAAGLSSAMHLLHRWGEPGQDPYAGFLAWADAVVVTGDSVARLSEACATDAPVFIALPELGWRRERRLHAGLIAADQARPLGEDLSPLPRAPLDEASRVAQEIRGRFLLDLTRLD